MNHQEQHQQSKGEEMNCPGRLQTAKYPGEEWVTGADCGGHTEASNNRKRERQYHDTKVGALLQKPVLGSASWRADQKMQMVFDLTPD